MLLTRGLTSDFDSVCALYARVTSAMHEKGIAQWNWGTYPNADQIHKSIDAGTLYVVREGNTVVAAVTLDSTFEPAYDAVNWLFGGKPGTSAAVVPQWEETAGISRSDVHTRTDIPSKLFVGGETGFGGAWAKIKGDKGVAVAFAILPDELDTNKFKYLRFTSWRMLRSFCQIAGNLGASFVSDKWLLESRRNDIRSNKLSFNGYWRYAEEDSIKNGDPASPKFDDSQWSLLNLIGHIDEIGASKVPFKKNYWIRKNIFIPKDWKKSEGIKIWLGKIVGGDELFVNGKRAAATKKHPQSYLQERIYEIPFDAVVFGGNNIFALRVEPYSSGRVCWSSQVPLYLNAELGGQYSPDYIEDHPDGDNPFRYMKW